MNRLDLQSLNLARIARQNPNPMAARYQPPSHMPANETRRPRNQRWFQNAYRNIPAAGAFAGDWQATAACPRSAPSGVRAFRYAESAISGKEFRYR